MIEMKSGEYYERVGVHVQVCACGGERTVRQIEKMLIRCRRALQIDAWVDGPAPHSGDYSSRHIYQRFGLRITVSLYSEDDDECAAAMNALTIAICRLTDTETE